MPYELPGFTVSPSKDQVVFQNDSFQLTCSSLWQPRGQLVWEIEKKSLTGFSIKEFADLTSRKNETVLMMNRYGRIKLKSDAILVSLKLYSNPYLTICFRHVWFPCQPKVPESGVQPLKPSVKDIFRNFELKVIEFMYIQTEFVFSFGTISLKTASNLICILINKGKVA